MCWSRKKVTLFIMFDFVAFDNNMDERNNVASSYSNLIKQG